MDDPVPAPDDRDLLAAELALGVLEGEALALAQRRLMADPAFAEEVEAWRERLADIALEAEDVAAPDTLWPRIAAAIASENAPSSGEVILMRRLRRWRIATIGTGAMAAALAGLLLIPQQDVVTPPASVPAPDPGPLRIAPAVVAQLRGAEDGPIIAARYNPGTAELRLHSTDMGQGELAPELWVIPADGVPRSLGLIKPAGRTVLKVAEGHRSMMADGATLAVTMEPPATAPHAAPSSAAVASGKIFGI